MTRRFDRPSDGGKLHMQSLAGLAHYDFNLAGAYSYEQALLAMRRLGLPKEQVEQQFRRMAFNVGRAGAADGGDPAHAPARPAARLRLRSRRGLAGDWAR